MLAISLLALSWIDLETYLLPNWLTLPLLVGGVVYSYMFGVGLLVSLAGAIIGYGLIWGISIYWRTRLKREGIGLGDAKLLAAGGAWTGVFALPLILLISSGAALAGIALIAFCGRSVGRHQAFPFGPMLALGIWIVWCMPAIVPGYS